VRGGRSIASGLRHQRFLTPVSAKSVPEFQYKIGSLVRSGKITGTFDIIDVVRKQYYFKPTDCGYDAWDVGHLIELSADTPVKQVSLTMIPELDTVHWFGADGSSTTVRILVRHMQLINEVDLSYPIILGTEGQIMDGMHRVARCLLDGRLTVAAVQFIEQPEPDHKDAQPSDLSYD